MTNQFLQSSPKGYQQLTVSTTAVGLTLPTGAQRAVIHIEAQPIRYRDDGTDPTSTVGVLVKADVSFELNSLLSLRQFKAIRSGSVDATVNVVYYGASKVV